MDLQGALNLEKIEDEAKSKLLEVHNRENVPSLKIKELKSKALRKECRKKKVKVRMRVLSKRDVEKIIGRKIAKRTKQILVVELKEKNPIVTNFIKALKTNCPSKTDKKRKREHKTSSKHHKSSIRDEKSQKSDKPKDSKKKSEGPNIILERSSRS